MSIRGFIRLAMTLAALATMSTVAIAQERAAPSACQPLPEVSWWNSNQRDIVALVDQRYGGNWDAYIEKWDDYRRRMQAIYDKGSVAVVKSQDLRLEGAELAEHIEQVRARISTTKCLALENGAKSLENFETAAGGDPSQRIQPREPIVSTLELAAVDGKVYETKISASCDDRSAVFQVANLGDKWPKTAMVTLFAEDGKTMISEREIRLSDKQNVMFQAKYDTGRRNGNVRLRIDPSWTGQQASYEAHIICD